jgi:hypothetical protein
MIWTRRLFTAAIGAGLSRATDLPKLAVVFVDRTPERSGALFTRAYAACPALGAVRQSIATAMFPHAGIRPPLLAISAVESPGVPTLFVTRPSDDSPFERSVRLPMLLRHPRAPATPFDFPLSTVDIAPTVYGLSGVDIPEGLHGRDVSQLLLTGRGERPESVYVEGGLNTADEWRAVVRGYDKLVVRPNLDILHMFNLAEDPGEEHDLAQEIGYRLRIDELRALVRAWMRRTSDGQDPSGLRRR